LQRQVVADTRLGDRDAWALYREADRGVAAILPMREGLAREPATLRFEGEIVADAELMSKLLNTWYDAGEVPGEILVPVLPPDHAALEEVLGERRGARVRLHAPERGDKAALVEIAGKAARARFQSTHAEAERIARALAGLAEVAGLDAPPYRVECFDNSNLLGQDPVASQVVFLDGRPAKKEYRRYQVKTVVGADDYATMREILGRRLRRAAEEGTFPDLVIVDGGRGQLSAAEDVLADLGLLDLRVIGVAKPRTERRRGERDAVDKIIVRGRAEPVVLRYDDPTLRLVQHIRDEAHRTAIGYHRERRSKRAMTSALDAIPGIAASRRKALLVHFGSMAAVRAASAEDIAALPGFGPALAAKIVAALKGS
jgi:excinuclease ABC subunit C